MSCSARDIAGKYSGRPAVVRRKTICAFISQMVRPSQPSGKRATDQSTMKTSSTRMATQVHSAIVEGISRRRGGRGRRSDGPRRLRATATAVTHAVQGGAERKNPKPKRVSETQPTPSDPDGPRAPAKARLRGRQHRG